MARSTAILSAFGRTFNCSRWFVYSASFYIAIGLRERTPIPSRQINRMGKGSLSLKMNEKRHQVQLHFDRRASGYESKYQHPATLTGFEKVRRMELLVAHVESLKPQLILDAGSGPGVVLSVLENRLPDAQMAGVDLSFLMLQEARATSDGRTLLAQAVVEQLPFPDDSFDLVYALGVVDYLEDPQKLFEAVRRVVKTGGVFIFTFPNADCVNRKMRVFLRKFLRNSRDTVSASGLQSAGVAELLARSKFELLQRHFITYGNGLITLPWSVTLSKKMEAWCSDKPMGRHLAWSGLCVVRAT